MLGGVKRVGLKKLATVSVEGERHVLLQGEGGHVLPCSSRRRARLGCAALRSDRRAASQGSPASTRPSTGSRRQARPSTRSRRTSTGGGATRPRPHAPSTCPRPFASGHAAWPTKASSTRGTRAEFRPPKPGCATTPSASTRSRSTRPTTHLPDPAVTAAGPQRTPPEFVFHVKAHAAMTWHEPASRATPPSRSSVPRSSRSSSRGKLRGILLQYHPRFVEVARGAREELGRARRASTRSFR